MVYNMVLENDDNGINPRNGRACNRENLRFTGVICDGKPLVGVLSYSGN